jgi:hypothetical protein
MLLALADPEVLEAGEITCASGADEGDARLRGGG